MIRKLLAAATLALLGLLWLPTMASAATPPYPAPPVTPGTVLAGKYRVERIIGQGGMGLVVEARHLALDERVANAARRDALALQPDPARGHHGMARAYAAQSKLEEAMEEAQTLVSDGTDGAIEELMEQPMLASVLESGLAAFDLSCNGVGDVT